jgi:hypothetical protein
MRPFFFTLKNLEIDQMKIEIFQHCVIQPVAPSVIKVWLRGSLMRAQPAEFFD